MEKKRFGLAAAVVFLALVQVSVSVPFIVLHGIAAACSEGKEANFTQLLSNFSGSPGFCLEVGNGELDSWFMPLAKQAEIACEKVKQMKELRQGYNIVGRSQGNLVARGLIEFCDGGPPVYNYVSLAGPHAGISSVPMCGSGLWCEIADELIKSDIYSDFIQDHLAPSGYLKIPTEMKKYLESSKYLPKLNNEIPNQRNSTYKERFASLHNLVLIMFEDDKVIVPKDSSWFGFYPDGDFGPLLTVRETKLFKEDWIGLKPLVDTGKVEFVHERVRECILRYMSKEETARHLRDRYQIADVCTEIDSPPKGESDKAPRLCSDTRAREQEQQVRESARSQVPEDAAYAHDGNPIAFVEQSSSKAGQSQALEKQTLQASHQQQPVYPTAEFWQNLSTTLGRIQCNTDQMVKLMTDGHGFAAHPSAVGSSKRRRVEREKERGDTVEAEKLQDQNLQLPEQTHGESRGTNAAKKH
ncbi:unnamed protein product [Brassica rapa]|uniref:Palmitoyl protein thioesterase family protein n=1 Tax=Brassica campestris TaxID=3711 RepID=A0A8D9G8C4_BRACM|nr:unnamed protein product [Brassica rapa]